MRASRRRPSESVRCSFSVDGHRLSRAATAVPAPQGRERRAGAERRPRTVDSAEMSSIQDDRYARPSPTSGASVVTGPALRCPQSGELQSYLRCVIIRAFIHTMDKRPAIRIRRLGSLDGPPSVVEIHKRGAVELVFDLPEPDLVEVT